MRKIVLFPLLFLTLSVMGRHTIFGTFSPADNYSWLIAYHLEPDGQSYVADSAINSGKFTLVLPENSVAGIYRLVYALPQDEFYFDVIYNGIEDVQLHFDVSKGVDFSTSEENKIFNAYFRDIHSLESEIIQLYSEGKNKTKEFETVTKSLRASQTAYEELSKDMLTQHFVKANSPYIPLKNESLSDYVKNRKANYFTSLDLKNPILQASGFLTDKISNYVYTALPLEQMGPLETERAMQENTRKVNGHLEGTSAGFKFHVFHNLWKQAAANDYNTLSDFIYKDYLTPLAATTKDQEIINTIKTYNRLRLGAIAPEIEWRDDNTVKKLSDLNDSKYYMLIFWSSTCGHCLRDLPRLYEGLKQRSNLRVIAIGLEDDDVRWKIESAQFENFEHVLALGKWENEYAELYDIEKTPTYFVLDKEKRIIAKLGDSNELIKFLNEN
ncbi:thioredoxin-like domain-containing protein [Ulvibacterium sp.]|uniref:TlpA family protein disulfide reductase n=1 Tax=Ulvibacterium sp. TaxID=2665914 RepID=UPI002622C7D1|nr:thioredoxin-like domain-containing protein [Ulvibacterium sp.]